MVSKKNIAEAISKFIANDLVQGIDDNQLCFVLCIIKQSISENADILDSFFDNPMIESVIHEENGMYDIKDFTSMLKKVINEYGAYSVTIPKVPLLLPNEKIIKINSSDIDKIVNYLNEEDVL